MVHPLSVAAVLLVGAILTFFWVKKASIVQGIVLANFAVFILMLVAGQMAGAPFGSIIGTPFLEDLAFRPTDLAGWNLLAFAQVFTAAFLHANFLHIFGNMIILLLAGMPFEDRIGRGNFLLIYLFSAVVAVLLHVIYTRTIEGTDALGIPLLGASGAVFGILAAFATTYPHDRIPMWLFFIILPRVPVIVVALIFMLVDGLLLFAVGGIGVARAAHLGGAVGGAILAPFLKRAHEASRALPPSRRFDVVRLESLAITQTQTRYVERLKENLDHPETAQAWFDRLATTLSCTTCSKAYTHTHGTRATCPDGHEDRYDTKHA